MRTVIVVSRCLDERVGKVNFHFKGFYAGAEVSALRLTVGPEIRLLRNQEYILYVRVSRIEVGILEGEVLRCRLLDELTF